MGKITVQVRDKNNSLFIPTPAFSQHKILSLNKFEGKKVVMHIKKKSGFLIINT